MSDESLEQKAMNYETMRHIEAVRNLIGVSVKELLNRAKEHDQEKMRDPEVSLFAKYTPLLKNSTYGSPEYQQFLTDMKPALDHHYATYRHHPEHNNAGMNDMNLIDLMEMMCDWIAASRRHNDGNILKSIEFNRTRFGMPDMMVNILRNTAIYFEQIER